jgi:hypothetical protein
MRVFSAQMSSISQADRLAWLAPPCNGGDQEGAAAAAAQVGGVASFAGLEILRLAVLRFSLATAAAPEFGC